MLSLVRVESDLRANFNSYWSLFYMSGESEFTSHEWARSQMIEVSEALFWTAFEKPKKLYSVDRFVIGEWLERIRAGREYYDSKEDLLLLLSFACHWNPDRICDALKISKSAFYFRLFYAIRLRSPVFRSSSGHLSAACAHFDLRFAEYLLPKRAGELTNATIEQKIQSHLSECSRCSSVSNFANELADSIDKDWNQLAPEAVFEEAMQPFVAARIHPIKKNFWTRIPPWVRTLITAAVVLSLAYYAFR